jgi:hypothetical protein
MISGRYVCPDCNQFFRDSERLDIHRISFLPDIPEHCHICNTSIPSCVSKVVHLQSHPLCTHCNKCFMSKDKYLMHVMTNHPDTVPRNLTIHVGYGGVTCFICGWIFKETALADIHVHAFHPVFLAIFKRWSKNR